MKPKPEDNTLSLNDCKILTSLVATWDMQKAEKVLAYIKNTLDLERVAIFSTILGNEEENLNALKVKFQAICESEGLVEFWREQAEGMQLHPRQNLSNFKLFMGEYLLGCVVTDNEQHIERWCDLIIQQYQSISAFYLCIQKFMLKILSGEYKALVEIQTEAESLERVCASMGKSYPAVGLALMAMACFAIGITFKNFSTHEVGVRITFPLALRYFELSHQCFAYFLKFQNDVVSATDFANLCKAEEGEDPRAKILTLWGNFWRTVSTRAEVGDPVEVFRQVLAAETANAKEELYQETTLSCRVA